MNIKGKQSRTNTDLSSEIKKFINDLLVEGRAGIHKPDQFLMKTGINLTRFLKSKNPSIPCFDSIAKGFGFEDGHELWGEMKKRRTQQPPTNN